jgi:predicted DNA-binding transcriptional regulator AlpA
VISTGAEMRKEGVMSNQATDAREMLSLRETSIMIRACVRGVYRLIDEGKLPRQIKIRSRSYLPKSAVRAYLVQQGLPDRE